MRRLFLLCFFFSLPAFAVDLIFLQHRGRNGKPIQLEPGGRFTHLAMKVDGGWIHSHPQRGVEIVSLEELGKMGEIVEQVSTSAFKEPTPAAIAAVLGKPYDPTFSWSDDKLYCSELIAKLLKIPPAPMTFDGPLWGAAWIARRGEPGLSPHEVFAEVSRPQKACSKVF